MCRGGREREGGVEIKATLPKRHGFKTNVFYHCFSETITRHPGSSLPEKHRAGNFTKPCVKGIKPHRRSRVKVTVYSLIYVTPTRFQCVCVFLLGGGGGKETDRLVLMAQAEKLCTPLVFSSSPVTPRIAPELSWRLPRIKCRVMIASPSLLHPALTAASSFSAAALISPWKASPN